ncbi:MAG: hypothetical protein U0270_20450 [Labilithrix sp.]
MNLRALTCCRCGGPLANPEALPALIDCLYCGTVNSATPEATQASQGGMPWDVRKNAIAKFTEALVAALQEGRAPFDAIRVSSAAHLGIAGRADTVARISLALAQDFEREAGVSIVRDAVVLSRIAQAYLLALEELRTSDSFDLNLPFITATPKGPVHLQRRLTAKLLSELAAREPRLDGARPASPAAGGGAAPPPKKKGWWPFS